MGSYLIGGVNGVGKSALFDAIQEKRPDITVVHTAGALMEWLGIKPGNYDTLRNLPDDYKNHHNGLLVSYMISELPENQTTIFDGHYLNLIKGKTKPTVAGHWPSLLSGIVLVEADSSEVYKRIKNSSRDRKLFPVDQALSSSEEQKMIENFIIQTRQEFYSLAGKFALPHAILSNKNDYLERTTDDFLRFDEQLQNDIPTDTLHRLP